MTNYTEVKISELEGVALDYAVAIAIGLVVNGDRIIDGPILVSDTPDGLQWKFAPSTDWADCGVSIDEYGIEFKWLSDATIEAYSYTLSEKRATGESHRIAACRLLALELGESVKIPNELLE